MQKSKHNIISKIANSEDYFIVNLLSQEADILTQSEMDLYHSNDPKDLSGFVEKGYVVNLEEEKKLFNNKYLEFVDNRDTDEIQLFFVPDYTCNFSCSYCYQDEYLTEEKNFDTEVVDAFFEYINSNFANRKKYITVFGGEPLLNSRERRVFLQYFIDKANTNHLDLAFVTNGYFLSEYIPLLKKAKIREIQVTLDGVGDIHDARRMLKGGGGSFARIVKGVDDALDAELPVNLRMVVDKENVNGLSDLARFAIDKRWTKSSYFKTQLGRNYELHHCQKEASRLYSRLEMYQDIYMLIRKFPHITEFHKPAFSVSKYLFEEGELPTALFDSCPGTKTEWAFDYSGKIYSCTATVGKPGEELGTYYPAITMDNEQVSEWQDRDVLSIEKCQECELRLACGGGCASVAKNQFKTVHAPDCRPVKELLELGLSHYFSS